VELQCDYNGVLSREWNKRMTADQARMLYEKTLKQEQEFAQSFTGLCNRIFFGFIAVLIYTYITLLKGLDFVFIGEENVIHFVLKKLFFSNPHWIHF